MAGKKQPPPSKKTSASKKSGSKGSSHSSTTKASASRAPRLSGGGHDDDNRGEIANAEQQRAQLQRQQAVLDVFRRAFGDVLGAADFGQRVQGVKAALFGRDFDAAFAQEGAALDVYAARWSPTRALCYARVLRSLGPHLEGLFFPSCALPRAAGGSAPAPGSDASVIDDGMRSAEPLEIKAGNDDHDDRDETEQEEGKGAKQAQEREEEKEGAGKGETQALRILAIGGAAAEIVAFADYISSDHRRNDGDGTATDAAAPRRLPPLRAEVTLLDVGPWGPVVDKLQTVLTTPPPLSRYASAAARANGPGTPLVSAGCLDARFMRRDALELTREELEELMYPARGNNYNTHFIEKTSGDERNGNADITADKGEAKEKEETAPTTKSESKREPQPPPILITLLFTLNELYTSAGTRRATSFLRLLSAVSIPGTLLLVIDSPGSYSEATVVGAEARRYPMQWLLDHTLIPPPTAARRGANGTLRDTNVGDKKDEKDERLEREEVEEEKEEKGQKKGPSTAAAKDTTFVTWEKLESSDSVWFRVAEELRYPIPLENMRYQMHLYRASCPSSD